MEKMPETPKVAEALDARWYERFAAVSFEDYEKLAGTKAERAEQQRQFMAGEVENPGLITLN